MQCGRMTQAHFPCAPRQPFQYSCGCARPSPLGAQDHIFYSIHAPCLSHQVHESQFPGPRYGHHVHLPCVPASCLPSTCLKTCTCPSVTGALKSSPGPCRCATQSYGPSNPLQHAMQCNVIAPGKKETTGNGGTVSICDRKGRGNSNEQIQKTDRKHIFDLEAKGTVIRPYASVCIQPVDFCSRMLGPCLIAHGSGNTRLFPFRFPILDSSLICTPFGLRWYGCTS